eukprot:tig00020723_g13519.t1
MARPSGAVEFDLSVVRPYRERTSGIKESDQFLNAVCAKVQQHACQRFGSAFRCIQEGRFVWPRMSMHPDYSRVLEELRKDTTPPPLLLDVGCCTGTDLRKLVLDGVPASALVGIELDDRFLELGYELFQDRGNANAPRFYAMDFLATRPPANLLGAASHVYAGSVLHLLSETAVEAFVFRARSALRPGGVFFGRNLICDEPGQKDWAGRRRGAGGCQQCLSGIVPRLLGLPAAEEEPRLRYLHSQETLTDLLKRKGFRNVRVFPAEAPDMHANEKFQGMESKPYPAAFWAEKAT